MALDLYTSQVLQGISDGVEACKNAARANMPSQILVTIAREIQRRSEELAQRLTAE